MNNSRTFFILLKIIICEVVLKSFKRHLPFLTISEAMCIGEGMRFNGKWRGIVDCMKNTKLGAASVPYLVFPPA